jgi:type 1 glutamine amidotransferase
MLFPRAYISRASLDSRFRFGSAFIPFLALLTMLLLAALAPQPVSAQANPQFKVLVLGLQDSNHPGTGAAGIKAVQEIAAGQNYTVDASTDYGKINDASLAAYQVVIFTMAWQGAMPAAAQAALQKYVESGKGWMGFHTSTLTGISSPAWAWYDTWLGGGAFKGHPATRQNGTVKLETDAAAASHPVLQGMPASFSVHEEWYSWNKSPRGAPDIKILATVDETTYDPGGTAMGKDHPVVWSNTKYGPMIITSLCHEPEAFGNANVRKLIANAIPWLAKAGTSGVTPVLPARARAGLPVLSWDGRGLRVSQGDGRRFRLDGASLDPQRFFLRE